MGHLLELRDRLMRMVLSVLILLVVLFPFGNDIYVFVADPLMKVLPEGTTMIATQVASPFLTPFKLAMVAAIFLAMPYLLYQFWGFIAPGLYQREKRLAFPMLASSILLFYLGAAFAYVVVFPLVFAFLTSVAPEGVAVMTDITHYLDFVLTLFFAFGLSFEVPIATILLVMVGMTTPQKLANKRPLVIVGAFVLGMFLTPPDVISQTLLAVPIWLLFELGVFLSRILVRNRDAERQARADAEDNVVATEAEANENSSDVASAALLSEEASYDYDNDDYEPLTEEELDAELDLLEEEDEDEDEDDSDSDSDSDIDTDIDTDTDTDTGSDTDTSLPEEPAPTEMEPFVADAVDEKLEKIMTLRNENNIDEARGLLYEVLAEGSEAQIKVARNILAQLDS